MPEGNPPRNGRLENSSLLWFSLLSGGRSKRKHRSLLRSGFLTLRLVDSNLPENLRCASAMMMKGIHSQAAAHGQKNTFSDARRQTCAPRQNLIGSVLVHKPAP